MHRTLVGTLAAIALASVSSAALAADMAPPEPAPSWSGIYLGAGGGFQWGDLDVESSGCRLLYDYEGSYCDPYHSYSREFQDRDSSPVGVVQGGYDLQIGQYFVTGSYVSWTFGDSLGSDHKRYFDDDGVYGKWSSQVQDMLTVAGRQGFLPMPNLMIYGLAGWSWANIDHHFKIDCDECSEPIAKLGDSFNANGVTVGLGAEYKWTDYLSLRGEYRFTNLDNVSDHRYFSFEEDDHFARSKANINVQQVLLTLNWRFGNLGLPF